MDNNYIKVKVVGKNINNYIKWIISKKISIAKLNIINHNELNLIVDYKYYKQLSNYSKTYKVSIIKKYGKLRIIDIIKNNSVILICLVLAICFLYFLSNMIFSVEVLYNDEEIASMIKKELEKYDIKIFKFKKNRNYLEKVKEQILNDKKDNLEWIEIEENGTKYIVKLVERKKQVEEQEYEYQSIVSSKDAIITKITATSGEKIKNINQYVKKDEIIINGILTKPDGTDIYTKAKGKVYGEIWYKITVEYPLYYQEELVTGKNKNVVSINFLNKKIPLFPYKKYKQFKLTSTTLIEDNILPIKIVKENLYEVKVKEEIYTEEEAIDKAIELSKKKIIESNDKIIEVNDIMIISKENLNSKIKLELFASVIEDITKIIEIKEEIIEENNQ